MEKSEKSALQINSNDFKLLAEVPLILWVVFALLLLTLVGALKPGIAALLAIAALIANHHIKQADKLREAKARAASYANMIGPIVIGSDNPEENVYDVQEKAKAWRERLELSGNPYAKQLPIIEFPYSPMLYGTGQLSAGWSLYQKQLAETQHMENLKWHEGKCPNELKALFASAVLPSPQNTTQQ